ncbi:response regulator transcription factor [Hymenobacter sp. M29]|uniref:Response regulator transcription factor n=1 Tax=Hymenobacter mellowenesis TaxID=3063995 RepID=A0ABT9A9D7_9BACT|nr:response regulator transcription factor [Hymenobacter sp. M29]MDO7846443.1 response regulator transcription factor [Hymenobacter sp. M29]
MTRLFIVDDHALVRNGLRAVLAAEPDLQVIGEAADGHALLHQLPATPADIVLLDLSMPGLDGMATACRLREDFPAVAILVISSLAHECTVAQAFAAGARGYILKNAAASEVVASLRAVAAGRRFLSTEIGLAMLHKVTHSGSSVPAPSANATEALTSREQQVLQCVADGLTNVKIADKLFMSKRTVETHRQNIIAKTQTKNTAALIKFAVQNGLLLQAQPG